MNLFDSLLLDRRWRWLIGYARFIWYTRTRGIKVFQSPRARAKTVSHNLTAFEHVGNDFRMPRMTRLIHGLLATEELTPQSSILVIGPRTENDLLLLQGHGFRKVIGLDLISYSPWITVGDMHDIPFADSTFDAVLCGWTMSYSEAPKSACREFVRVLRHGGVVALGVEHVPPHTSRVPSTDPRLIDLEPLEQRINTASQIIALFDGCLAPVYTSIDAPLAHWEPSRLQRHTGLASSQVIVVGAVNKEAAHKAI